MIIALQPHHQLLIIILANLIATIKLLILACATDLDHQLLIAGATILVIIALLVALYTQRRPDWHTNLSSFCSALLLFALCSRALRANGMIPC